MEYLDVKQAVGEMVSFLFPTQKFPVQVRAACQPNSYDHVSSRIYHNEKTKRYIKRDINLLFIDFLLISHLLVFD